MDDIITSATLVCQLSSKTKRSKVKALREEIISHLLKQECLNDGALFTFPLKSELRHKVERLVELEKGCCAFFTHKVESVDNKILWSIRSEGAGVMLAQKYLFEQTVKKSKFVGAGFKAAALLTACGFACTAPIVLGAMGFGIAGIGVGKLGAEIAILGVVVIAAGAYWYYKKRKNQMVKGTKNENRCSC